MKFVRIGLNGDYVYQETISGHDQQVRIPIAENKAEARKRAKAAFDELKAKLANGTAKITDTGTLILDVQPEAK